MVLELVSTRGRAGIETIRIRAGTDEVVSLVRDLYDLPGQVAAKTEAVERWVDRGGGGDGVGSRACC